MGSGAGEVDPAAEGGVALGARHPGVDVEIGLAQGVELVGVELVGVVDDEPPLPHLGVEGGGQGPDGKGRGLGDR